MRSVWVYYAITLALAVGVALASPVLGEASRLLSIFTPAVAVAIMLGLVAPEGSPRTALAGLGLDRAGMKGWPLAVGGPALIHLLGLAIMAATGLTVLIMPEVVGPPAAVALKLAIGMVLSTLFALAEEVAWRGYVLPRMGGRSAVGAMLLVGLLHGVWHLPLMLTTDYYHAAGDRRIVVPLFLITLSLAGVLYGFLRLWSGSGWPVAIAHAAANAAWSLLTEVSRSTSVLAAEYVGGESGLVAVVRYMRRTGLVAGSRGADARPRGKVTSAADATPRPRR